MNSKISYLSIPFPNQLKLSFCQNIDELHKEWFFIKSVAKVSNHCICNCILKAYSHYYINIITGKCCIVGKGCEKKLNPKNNNKSLYNYVK